MKRILSTALSLGTATFCFAQAKFEAAPAPAPADVQNTPVESSKRAVNRAPRATATPVGVAPGAPAQPPVANSFSSKTSRGDSIPPVIIRFSETDAKANADLEQDLYVMARVLSRMLERAEGDHIEFKMKVPMLLTGAGKSVRPMYIEGTGPLFMVKVNFPLMPTPKAPAGKTVKQTPDSEWDEAERDLYGAGTVDLTDEVSSNANYKEEQVEILKREIISALKNASNIRGLKADEFVNVTVFGQSTSRSRSTGFATTTIDSQTGLPVLSVFDNGSTGSKGTVMSLRVRKNDIDAFAGGKLDFDEFKTKVSTAAYIGSGAGMTSINSWLQESGSRFRQ